MSFTIRGKVVMASVARIIDAGLLGSMAQVMSCSM